MQDIPRGLKILELAPQGKERGSESRNFVSSANPRVVEIVAKLVPST